MRTLIILVNRNNKKDTVECLESLRRLEGDFDVFVADNASTDGSREAIEAWARGETKLDTSARAWDGIRDHAIEVEDVTWATFDTEAAAKADRRARWLTFASTGGSRGFPAGNNVGLRYGLTRDYDTFWLLNNDTVADPKALTTLIARVQREPGVGLVGSTLLFYHYPDTIQAFGGCGYNRWRGYSVAIGLGQRFSATTPESLAHKAIDHVLGAAMFVSRQAVEYAGLMNEDLYLYFDEIDWTFRMEPKYKTVYEPSSIVFHKHGGTLGAKKPSRHRIYYTTVNRILFTRQHYPAAMPTVILTVLADVLKAAIRGRFAVSYWLFRDLIFGLKRASYPLREIP